MCGTHHCRQFKEAKISQSLRMAGLQCDLCRRVVIYEKDGDTWNLIQQFGGQEVQEGLVVDGDSSVATLEEPLGVAFVGTSLYICWWKTNVGMAE